MNKKNLTKLNINKISLDNLGRFIVDDPELLKKIDGAIGSFSNQNADVCETFCDTQCAIDCNCTGTNCFDVFCPPNTGCTHDEACPHDVFCPNTHCGN